VSSEPLEPGDVLAPGYEVIEHLSRGRTLDVYDVWSSERGCRAIAKALRADRRGDDRARRQLVEEGRLLCELSHPHIVRGYDTLEQPELVVVMETLRGQTLAYLVEEGAGPLDVVDLSHLGLQLGSAIRYLHGRGVLHLDLKPSNVVAEAGRAKLIDLSVARPAGPIEAGVGTWCYMAPEQARGGEVTPAVDVWGMGAVLFEAVTGEPPFDAPDGELSDPDAASPTSAADGRVPWDSHPASYPQLLGRAARVDELRDLPRELADLVAACLDPEPERRPSIAALLARLEPLSDLPASERRWMRTSRPGSSEARSASFSAAAGGG
jgi:serine/threonine protein kinase